MSLIELPEQKFSKISQLLGKFNHYPVINAIIERNSPGRIFVDHGADPRSAFVLTKAGFSYLAGEAGHQEFNYLLKELLDHELFPVIQASNDPTLIFYPLADGWYPTIQSILRDRQVFELFRKQFTFNREKFAQQAKGYGQFPTGFSLHPIDQVLLDKTGSDMFPWESSQSFLENGFGFWLMAGNEIICECSSVFVGGGAVEINIHTAEKYRRRSLALQTATVFIETCLARGLRPNWECWWDNESSVVLAQKLGFEPVGDHPVFLVELESVKI